MLSRSASAQRGLLRLAWPRGLATASPREHELRAEINAFTHQRPFEKMSLPAVVSSISLSPKDVVNLDGVRCPLRSTEPGGQHDYERDYAHLERLCNFFIVNPPPYGAAFFSANLGGACHLRWERHSEMQTYTFYRRASPEDVERPFDEERVALSALPADWLRSMPGALVSATHFAVVDHTPEAGATEHDEAQFREVKRLLNHYGHITGAALHSRAFRCFSDWRVHPDGFSRIVLYAMPRANRMAAGKVVQRLTELEKYRTMAMMAMPLARDLAPEVDRLSRDLQHVVDAVDGLDGRDAALTEQRTLLHELCAITALAVKHQAASNMRFSASEAYAQIVEDRLEALRTERIDGVPSVPSFILAATRPALRTCRSVAHRLAEVTRASQLTAELMRTSLTVQQQAASAEQLVKIEQTARTQLLLQECVEGLSAVAITYYCLGCLGYVAKSAAALGALPAGASPELVIGASVPFVGLGVWRSLHAMKHAVLHGGAAGAHGDAQAPAAAPPPHAADARGGEGAASAAGTPGGGGEATEAQGSAPGHAAPLARSAPRLPRRRLSLRERSASAAADSAGSPRSRTAGPSPPAAR